MIKLVLGRFCPPIWLLWFLPVFRSIQASALCYWLWFCSFVCACTLQTRTSFSRSSIVHFIGLYLWFPLLHDFPTGPVLAPKILRHIVHATLDSFSFWILSSMEIAINGRHLFGKGFLSVRRWCSCENSLLVHPWGIPCSETRLHQMQLSVTCPSNWLSLPFWDWLFCCWFLLCPPFCCEFLLPWLLHPLEFWLFCLFLLDPP